MLIWELDYLISIVKGGGWAKANTPPKVATGETRPALRPKFVEGRYACLNPFKTRVSRKASDYDIRFDVVVARLLKPVIGSSLESSEPEVSAEGGPAGEEAHKS